MERDKRYTPTEMFDMLEGRLCYDYRQAFDPCPVNPTIDGLSIDWGPTCYVNPPFSQLKRWVDKALHEMSVGRVKRLALVVPWYAWKERGPGAVTRRPKYMDELQPTNVE